MSSRTVPLVIALAAVVGLLVGGVRFVAQAYAAIDQNSRDIAELKTTQGADHGAIQDINVNVALLCQASHVAGCRQRNP